MKKHFSWITALIIAVSVFWGISCSQEVETEVDKTAPKEVTNFTVTVKDNTFYLSWINPDDTDFAGTQISMNPAEGILSTPISLGKDETSFSVSGLTVEKYYTFTVKTFDTSLNYSIGETVVEKIEKEADKPTPEKPSDPEDPSKPDDPVDPDKPNDPVDTTAPASVTNLSAVYYEETFQITVSWKNPKDEDFAGTQLVYGKVDSADIKTLSFDKSYSQTVIQGIAADESKYSFKIVAIDTAGNTSEVASITVMASSKYKTPIIKEIIVPSFAVTFYCKEFPITIVGENFTTSNIFKVGLGGSIKNIKIISDTKVTAVITFINSIGAQSPCNIEIPIYCDDIEGIAVLKIIEKEKCFSIGDILNAYGERLKVDNLYYGVPDSYYSRVGVVVSTSYGGAMGKVVGLKKSGVLQWGTRYAVNTNYTDIETYIISGSSSFNNYNLEAGPLGSYYKFTGDIEGCDNWEYIFSMHPEESLINLESVFPAFSYARFYYGSGVGYVDSWYIPTIKELLDIYENQEIIQKSLTAAGGFDIGTDWYWSSNQSSQFESSAYCFNFSDKFVGSLEKNDTGGFYPKVMVMRIADASKCVDLDYGSPQITSVTMPSTIGEGYTGIIPVTIKGKNFTLPDVKEDMFLFDGASVTNIEIISDTLIQALVTTNVVVGTNSVTVSYGSSSGTGSFMGIESELCFTDLNIGNIILDDGTVVPLNQYNSSSMNPIAIVCGLKYNGGQVLGMGLYNSESEAWAHQTSIGCDLKFEGIGVNYSGSKDKGYIIEGDLDGFDNWDYICNIEPVDTTDSVRKYPVFYFANNYAKRAGLTETKYAENWFVPSIDELYNLYKNKDIIQKTLLKVGKFKLESVYWSSSHTIDDPLDVVLMDFDYDEINDDDKLFEYNVLVLRAFNPNLLEMVKPKIESVNLETSIVGKGYTGTIPITITGECLLNCDITSDVILSDISYISNTEISATIECDGIVGCHSVTVSCGMSSATTVYDVIEESFSVGDVLFTDGTKMKVEDVKNGIPDSKKSVALGVVVTTHNYGLSGKVLGVCQGKKLSWAQNNSTGYNTKFSGIKSTYSGSSSSGYTFSGDLDGSDNWDYICKMDSTASTNIGYYEIFNFANTYAYTANLSNQDYKKGWYVPSIKELYDVYKNIDIIGKSLLFAGGFDIRGSYWSSSQESSFNESAISCSLASGSIGFAGKNNVKDCLVLKSFSYEQFDNYEIATQPCIRSVNIETAGEGYVGELSVIIEGENLKGYDITCSDSTFSNIAYISDEKVTATIFCDGVVGEKTITIMDGHSSMDGIIKVIDSSQCVSDIDIGKIILSDGTFVSKEDFNYETMTAIAVIVGSKNNGGEAIGIGLNKSTASTNSWQYKESESYPVYFEGIESTYRGSSSSGYTISGDLDGSDNWDYICMFDFRGTKYGYYPIFRYANDYGENYVGGNYLTGWYVPSLKELYDVYLNKDIIVESIKIATNSNYYDLEDNFYSSSQTSESTWPSSYRQSALCVNFKYGDISYSEKRYANAVLVLRAFNAQ